MWRLYRQCLQTISIWPRRLSTVTYSLTGIKGIAFMKLNIVVYTIHVICQDIDGGATEADGGASVPVGPSVATPLGDIKH